MRGDSWKWSWKKSNSTQPKEKVKKEYKKRNTIYPIVQTTLDGKYIREIQSIDDIRDLSLSYESIYRCITNIQKTHNGYKFLFKNDYMKSDNEFTYILGIDENKNIIYKYSDIKECEYDLFNIENVRKSLKDQQAHHKNYVWIYSNEMYKLDEKINKLKHNKKKVKFNQIENDKVIYKFNSLLEAKRNGYTISCISKCLNGEMQTYLGYRWEIEK